MMKHPHHSGFTLIELSIVLVIIGLIVGGVLVGQDMIVTARLRAIITEREKFHTAVDTFLVKYNCYPGTCINATDFFGVSTTGCPIPAGGTSQGTCDGDGGRIFWDWPNYITTILFWHHLSLAGLVSGAYTGIPKDFPNGTPKSTTGEAHWSVWNSDIVNVEGTSTFNTDKLSVQLGTLYSGNGTYEPVSGFLTPLQAWSIDSKIDDGLPKSGRVYYWLMTGHWAYNPNCATDSSYNFSNTDLVCNLNFTIE